MATACANRGIGPQGGPKDEIPPKVLLEDPANGSLGIKPKIINIAFDEIVLLENTSENILISPPQLTPPTVKAYAKKVRITFDEPLKDSTTYTIDFGNAIVDNNEKNPLRGYTYSFSTGDVIDTLQIAGRLIYAENLNPMSGVVVGIHSNLSDTAFSSHQFERIAKTDSAGRFCIRNIRPGSYRLYALADANKDYRFQTGEGIAWNDSIITPTCHIGTLHDTVWFDAEIVDSLRYYKAPVYEPSDVLLRFSNEDLQRHYFMRAYREKQHCFQLVFAAPQDSVPIVKPLDGDSSWFKYAMPQYNATLDTLTYWLTDSAAMRVDTIMMQLTYQKSDSVFQLYTQTDTVRAIYRRPRQNNNNRNKGKKKTETVQRVEYKNNTGGKFDIYQPLTITFSTPIARIYKDSLHLSQKVDTTNQSLQFSLVPKDSSHIVYYVVRKGLTLPQQNEMKDLWEPSTEYKLQIDSGALHDIYGNTVDKKTLTFKTQSLEDYSSIKILIEPFDSAAVIQILNNKDQVVRSLPAQKDGTLFKYLKPDSYYMRLYIDSDHNSKWTPASYSLRRQPEQVYYFPQKLTLRANWDFEETWDYIHKGAEKPKELLKDQSTVKNK